MDDVHASVRETKRPHTETKRADLLVALSLKYVKILSIVYILNVILVCDDHATIGILLP